jgi:hypothetical protein
LLRVKVASLSFKQYFTNLFYLFQTLILTAENLNFEIEVFMTGNSMGAKK